MTAPIEPMTAEREAGFRALAADDTTYSGEARMLNELLATIDALRLTVSALEEEGGGFLDAYGGAVVERDDARATVAAQAKVIACADAMREIVPILHEEGCPCSDCAVINPYDAARAALGEKP